MYKKRERERERGRVGESDSSDTGRGRSGVCLLQSGTLSHSAEDREGTAACSSLRFSKRGRAGNSGTRVSRVAGGEGEGEWFPEIVGEFGRVRRRDDSRGSADERYSSAVLVILVPASWCPHENFKFRPKLSYTRQGWSSRRFVWGTEVAHSRELADGERGRGADLFEKEICLASLRSSGMGMEREARRLATTCD